VEGVILIGDVAKGSPGEASGLKEGDVVISVNKNFSQNLNQYKLALQRPNEKILIVVRRNSELMEMELKVKSIY
jgi:S1-C subfamily serine protease